jgi:catechol 2,3-dioxygenase-like lactoylglutathione lyase family enzyme
MSLDHVGVEVADYDKSKQFYDTTLATLGNKPLMTFDWRKDETKKKEEKDVAVTGYGKRFPSFWISTKKNKTSNITTYINHIAFSCNSQAEVRKFYETAIKAGAKDNGQPGLRRQYHRNYYGAFVIDFDGNNIEACNHFDVSLYYKYLIPIVIGVSGVAVYGLNRYFIWF